MFPSIIHIRIFISESEINKFILNRFSVSCSHRINRQIILMATLFNYNSSFFIVKKNIFDYASNDSHQNRLNCFETATTENNNNNSNINNKELISHLS